MKFFATLLLVSGLFAVTASEANAAACAAGVYHAGCVGPRGAVGVHRPYGAAVRPYGAAVVHPYGAAVVRPVPHCYYRAGVRVCR